MSPVSEARAVGVGTYHVSPVNQIKLLCILGSEDGLKRVQEEYPGLEVCHLPMSTDDVLTAFKIWAAAVDPELTKDGLISPGLGDTVSVSCFVLSSR